MKITVNQTELTKKLNNIARVVSSKPQLPILACVLLKVDQAQGVKLFATDLNIGIQTSVVAQIEEEGIVAIPSKIFVEVVKSLGKGDLELSLKENTLTLKSQSSKTQIQCQSGEEFPDFPTFPELQKKFTVPSMQIMDKYVGFSTSLDQARLILTTLLLKQSGDSLQVVGTDGFRLSVLDLQEKILDDGESFLIGNNAFKEVVRLSIQENVEEVGFEVSDELKQIYFSVGEVELFMRLIEGSYPPFEKIIPAGFEKAFAFDSGEFEDTLKQAMVFAKEVSGIVTLKISDGEMTIVSNASAKGAFEGKIGVEVLQGEEGEISFNAKYLLDLLKNVKPKRVVIKMNDKLKPALFTEEGNKFFQYVVMPFRLNG